MSDQEQKSKSIKLKNVKVIKADSETATVEYVQKGRVVRKIIPSDKLKGKKVDESILELGVDYGIPWADILEMKATPQQMEDKLHAIGVWTSEDVIAHSREIMGAIQSVYGVELSTIFRTAKIYKLKEVKK
jgi:hypothetical protein